MDLRKTFHDAWFEPKFYRRFRKPGPVNLAYRYYLLLGLVSSILSFLVGLATIPFFTSLLSAFGLPATGFNTSALAWNAVFGYVYLALFIFPCSWFVALGLRMAGAKCSFRQAFHVEAYSLTPSLALNWIPGISLIGAVWSIYLWFRGLKEATGASYGTILGGALIGGLIMAALAAVLMLPFMLWYLSAL